MTYNIDENPDAGNQEADLDEWLKDALSGDIPPIDQPDFSDLMQQANLLDTNSPPEAIQSILEASLHLNALESEQLLKCIKTRTHQTMQSMRSYIKGIEGGETASEPDHLELAQAVIANIGRENLLADLVYRWRWYEDKGVWRIWQDREIAQITQNILASRGCFISRHLVESVSQVMHNALVASSHQWNIAKDAINFTNGELHWVRGEGWQLLPHQRSHYFTSQIPHEYDPAAECPRFLRFLDEIFIHDADKQAKQQSLLEMMGYSFCTHTRFEKFVILIGAGANGKSVLLEVIRHMLGKENVCAVQPSQFSNRFQQAHLHNKLANLITEIAEGKEIADADIKAITSGELLTTEHKHKPPFDFTPYCTCWFGTNHMPHSRDYSEALFRRAIIIPFNRVFTSQEQDPNLKRDLISEINGIIPLCLAAYAEVIKRGQFTEAASSQQAKHEWRTQIDQVRQFIDDKCVLNPNYETQSKDLYSTYRGWVEEQGITHKLSQRGFVGRLRQHGCMPHKGTAGTRIIKGIRIGWEVGAERCEGHAEHIRCDHP